MNEEQAYKRAGGAGMIAATVMVATQLAWRMIGSTDNVVQALPEFVAAAIARLTPISVFGTVTETYGSWAKRTLLVMCCLGIIAVGIWAGRLAWRLAGPPAPTFARRLGGGLIAAVILLGIVLAVILPIANIGIAANKSSHTNAILAQLVITFGLFALVFAALSGEPAPSAEDVGRHYSRRTVALSGTWLVLGLGALAVSTLSIVKMFRSKPLSAAEISQQQVAVQQILEQQQSTIAAASPIAGTPASAPTLFASLEAAGQLTPLLTETRDFYHVSKNFTDPTVSSDGWSLEIGGSVANPQTYTLDELNELATVKNITTLGCVSNEINGDLISTAEWTGIRLKDLLDKAVVASTAVDLKFTAADDYSDSIPVAIGMDPDVLLVVGINGQPLPDDHGFPARMIVPPIYGMKNVKWLKKIEAVDYDYKGYWQELGWSDEAHYQIWGRFDYPTGGSIAVGDQVLCGLASAGDRGISKVEISLDDGQTWADAQMEPPLNSHFTWIRWAYPFTATPGSYHATMRATDGNGTLMTEDVAPPLPDGATGWVKQSFHVA